VGDGAVVGAGAVVPEGAEIPANALALGIPAKVVRETTPQERERFAEGVGHYVEMIAVHGGQRG
jgi:carbonic anhydrase/acetyltransferase-like protein (isoleucine patch superfamily)